MTNRSQILSALEKMQKARRDAETSHKQDAVIRSLTNALDTMGRVTAFTGPKGEKGDRGLIGPRGERGPQGVPGPQGERGPRGFDGTAGIDGKDGKDGTANMDEVMECAEECAEHEMEEHEKEYDHKLLHDSKMLGEYELDQTTLKDGDILQVKGKKLVGIKLQMPDVNGLRNWVSSQGVSNMRHSSVTASRELEPFVFWIVDATAGNITLTIPSASGRENQWFEVMRIDGTANSVSIVPTGSETFSGMSDYSLSQWTDFQLFAYNSNYLIRQAS